MLLAPSPVTLLVFRRLVLDEEHVCDDLAVRLTGSPEPLARALELLAGDGSISGAAPGALEDRAHFLQLRERIERLRRGVAAPPCGPPAYLAVALSLALFGYLVV